MTFLWNLRVGDGNCPGTEEPSVSVGSHSQQGRDASFQPPARLSRFFPDPSGKWTLKGGAAEQIYLLFPKCFLWHSCAWRDLRPRG